MTNEYVLATNDDGDLAVRTVSATEASGITDTQNVITRTEDGKLAIRTVGSGGGGGSSLPDQTGQSGKFLTTDGTDASWSNSTTESLYFRNGSSNMVGGRVFSLNGQNICIRPVKADGTDNGCGISIGVDTIRAEGATGTYNLGGSNTLWKNVYTQKINNGTDITVPTTGGTMAVIGVNTTATLAVADWSSNTQTVTVSGVKVDSVVFVSPDPTSASDYASAGILCTSQSADSLTFTCTTTPTNAITVNVVCM